MPYYQRNLYILSVTIFLTAVSWNQVIPFLPLFIREMGITDDLLPWVGWTFAAQAAASIVAQPFWGKLGDKYGRKPMAIRAGVCLCMIYFGMSVCTTPLQLIILRFLNGALTGFIPMSMALIATNTPEDKAPRAIATAQTASAAGLIAGPAIGGLLAVLLGYRGTMQISGTAVLISTILVWRLVREPNRTQLTEKTSLLQDFGIALRSKIMLAIMLTVMLYGIFGASIAPILALHLANLSDNPPVWMTGLIFSLMPLAMLLTIHAWTMLGERIGFDRTIKIGLMGAAACAFILTFAQNIWVFAILFFVTGVFLASLNPSTGAIICTRVESDFRGRAYGMQQSAAMTGLLIAPLIATLIGAQFGLSAVFVFIGVVALGGSFLFAMIWPRETVPLHEPILEPASESLAEEAPEA